MILLLMLIFFARYNDVSRNEKKSLSMISEANVVFNTMLNKNLYYQKSEKKNIY